MHLTAEAIIGIVALALALPPVLVILVRWIKSRQSVGMAAGSHVEGASSPMGVLRYAAPRIC